MVVGRRARQRRVHAYVAFIPREGPVHHAPLHRLRDALIAFLDALEGDCGCDYFRGDVEQGRRGARPAAGARRARGHGARSAARRGLTRPRARGAPRPPGTRAPNRHTPINYSFGRHNVRYIIKSWHFCVVLRGYDKIDSFMETMRSSFI